MNYQLIFQPPLIKMDAAVRQKMNSLFGNAGDKF